MTLICIKMDLPFPPFGVAFVRAHRHVLRGADLALVEDWGSHMSTEVTEAAVRSRLAKWGFDDAYTLPIEDARFEYRMTYMRQATMRILAVQDGAVGPILKACKAYVAAAKRWGFGVPTATKLHQLRVVVDNTGPAQPEGPYAA